MSILLKMTYRIAIAILFLVLLKVIPNIKKRQLTLYQIEIIIILR